MSEVCGDNRFEIIAKVKGHLINATNIEMQPEELKYADNILFRLWQLGYFDSIDKISKLKEQVADLQSDHEYNLELMNGLNKRIAELNKANEEIAELKSGCGMCYRKDKEQLTKAKELLKRWLRLYNTNTVKGIIADTEKFISEVEK